MLTVVLIAIILFGIHRSPVTVMIALSTIGVALAVARCVTAFLGEHLFGVSTVTASFLTAVVLGAGTDYGVFLISRYHELRRDGVEPQEAVRTAAAKVKHVIVASAATVAAACAYVIRPVGGQLDLSAGAGIGVHDPADQKDCPGGLVDSGHVP